MFSARVFVIVTLTLWHCTRMRTENWHLGSYNGSYNGSFKIPFNGYVLVHLKFHLMVHQIVVGMVKLDA